MHHPALTMFTSSFLATHVPLAAAVLIRRLGVPIPLSPVLVWAGAMTAHEPVLAVSAWIMCTVAGTVGDLTWYWAGRRYGYRILKLVCRITISPDACVQRTETIFERRGAALLISGSLVPGVGGVAPPLTGALGLPLATFVIYDAAGSALRAAVGLAAGLAFHEQIASLLTSLALLGQKAAVVVGVLVAVYVAYRWLRRWLFLRSLDIARVSVQELDAMIRRGDRPIVLDVRTKALRELDARRIPGAHPVDLDDIGRTAAALPSDREVVVYCACPHEATAAKVAMQLRSHGLRRVRPLVGGMDAWAMAGHPVERYSGKTDFEESTPVDRVVV